MSPLRSETRGRRRATTPTASAARRTRSTTQQSPSPRPSSRFIVSSSSSSSGSSSDSNASIPPSPSSRDDATGRTRRSPVTAAAQQSSPAAAETTYYWPEVRRHINNGGHEAGNHRFKAICPICYDELPVRGLEPSNELLQHEGGVLIGCGHIFCRKCLVKSFCDQREGNIRRTCPICRANMECQRCGVQGRSVTIPKENGDPNEDEELPLTVPEGGEQAAICLRCDARDWWISKVEHGQHGLPFRNVIESDVQRLLYHMMDRMEDDGLAVGMVEMEQQLLVLFKENFMRLLEEKEQHISQYMRNNMLSSESYPWQ